MFARFNENPAMTLQDIKETKRYGRTDARTDGRTDNVKTAYPLQSLRGGINISCSSMCAAPMGVRQETFSNNGGHEPQFDLFPLPITLLYMVKNKKCGYSFS